MCCVCVIFPASVINQVLGWDVILFVLSPPTFALVCATLISKEVNIWEIMSSFGFSSYVVVCRNGLKTSFLALVLQTPLWPCKQFWRLH